MQEAEMRGVELTLDGLQIVARAHDKGDADLVCGHVEDLERRQLRQLTRAHVDPDHAALLDRRVGLGLHLLLEVPDRRHARHVDAVAGHVELPAVIDAAYPALLVAAEEQRRAAMRAAMVHHAHLAGAVAERDQLLAEQLEAQRRPVALDLR
jgi:hypothetical protein